MKTLKTALVLIGVQKDYRGPSWGKAYPAQTEAEACMRKLLFEWRRHDLPVVHIREESEHPGSTTLRGEPEWEFLPFAEPLPGEIVVAKPHVCAFEDTGLQAKLEEAQIGSLIIAGYTADRSVLVTAWTAHELGYRPIVVSDASAAFDVAGYDERTYSAKEVHIRAMNGLSKFVTVTDTQSVLNSVLRPVVTTA
ncbi:isochorismatase family protein [Paenibacillus thermotolerans]|uniref:isochorismatase family protein n=1 Tax=Paenibacillus thermotolerans TaxID=3027807 RepID=UPI002367FBC6|nr:MULTISPECIES: isochorismatase family protein [unclassified Paenibacillus]